MESREKNGDDIKGQEQRPAPLVNHPPITREQPIAEPQQTRKFKRILVIEDSDDDRMIIRHFLEADGRYAPVIEPHAESALKRLRDGERFDLIITDYNLDDRPYVPRDGQTQQDARCKTGTEFIAKAKELLKDTPMKGVPFIICTRLMDMHGQLPIPVKKHPEDKNGPLEIIDKTFSPKNMALIAKHSGADQLPEA